MSMIGCFQRVPEQTIRDVLAKPKLIETVLSSADDDAQLDIDKAWHGLHFLLSGDAEVGEPPLDFILTGGAPVGDIDVGYGPARAFTPGEVRDIATALAPISVDTLRERFDPAAMETAAIYPEIWMRDPASGCSRT